MRLRSSRSSTIRASRSASFTSCDGELLDHRVVLAVADRLGEEPERADRRLELVAHVGDEVATNALDATWLRDVVHERGRADDVLLGVSDRHRRHLQHSTWGTEQRELLVTGLARRARPR